MHLRVYERWSDYRATLKEKEGALTSDVLQTLLSGNDHWQKIVTFIEKMLKRKDPRDGGCQ